MKTMCISAAVATIALIGHPSSIALAQDGCVFSDGLDGLEAKRQAEESQRQLDEILQRFAARNSASQQTTVLTIETPSASLERYCIRLYHYDAACNPTRPTSPLVLSDGVLGYAIRDASVFDPPAEPKPATPPPAADVKPVAKPAPPVAQPTLDDLLGIKPKPGETPATATTPKPADPGAATDGAPDQSKADLDRLLSAQEMSDAFKQAIALMGDASKRLNDHADSGLGTQRVQEDVVKRLDQLLASLDKQKQQGSGSPKPSPKNQDSQQDPSAKPKPKPGEGKGQKPQQGGDGMQSHDGPTLQEGTLKPELESARAAWGSLPARIRAMLMQGTEDRFSSRYKALTQEYYKRLAEENSK